MTDQPELEIVEQDNEEQPEPVEEEAKTETAMSKSYATPDLAREAGVYNSFWNVASQIAATEFVPSSLRNNPPKVFAAMLTGHGLGIDPMTALREITIIDGKAYLSAALQLSLVRKAGHEVSGTSHGDSATIEGRRHDTGETMTVTYTLEDAAKAGLVSIDADGNPWARSKAGNPLPWEKYTANMLWARAVTTLVDRLFSDCTVGESM